MLLKDMTELPIGICDGGKVHRQFECRSIMADHDIEIQKLSGNDIAAFVLNTVATSVSRFGDKSWKCEWPDDAGWSDEYKDKILYLKEAPAGDVFYAYLKSRLVSIGNTTSFKTICHGPNHQNKAKSLDVDLEVDLGLMEVDIIPDEKEGRSFLVECPPIDIDGVRVTKLAVKPLSWQGFEQSVTEEVYKNSLEIVRGCVYGFNSIPQSFEQYEELSERQIGRLISKKLLNELSKKCAEISGGPQLSIVAKCDICNYTNLYPIDWRYHSFFG